MAKLDGFFNSFVLGSIVGLVAYDIWLGAFAPDNLNPTVGAILRIGVHPLLALVFLYGVYLGFKKFARRPLVWTLAIGFVFFLGPYLYDRFLVLH